jgi:PmbA protein
MAQLLSSAQRAVKLAEKMGATEAEAFVSQSVQNWLTFHEKIESARTSQITGIGVRTAIGKRMGFSSSSSVEVCEVKDVVKMALAIAKASEPDPDWHSLSKKDGRARAKGVFDKMTAEIGTDTLAQKSIEIIDSVHKKDSRLGLARGNMATGKMMCAMANSHASEFVKKGTYASFSIRVKAEQNGRKGTGDEGCDTRSWRKIDFYDLVEEATQRALKSLDASSIPSTKSSVIFANDVFARILDVMFTGTISADAVQKGRSPWIGKIGQQIAQDSFSAMDDGTMKEGMMTWSFDDEGVPQQRTPVIEKGILRSYLYDTYTAAKSKVASTGNARRSRSYGFGRPYTRTPTPSPSNFVLKPGDAERDELIEETRDGILVLTTIGEWLSNSISGTLNATVTNGLLVKNGELSDPVKGVIVSGDFFELIQSKIDLIAKDTRNDGNFYSPSVRVHEMSVAGR